MSFDQKLSRAAALAEAGRFDETEAACLALLQKKPKSFHALQLLGLAQSHLGRPEEAVETLRKAVGKDRQHAGVRNNLGNALMALGRYRDAHEAFQQAVEIAPTDPGAYVGLGVALMNLGRLQEATEALERSLRWGPGSPEAHDALGLCLMKQGQLKTAMKNHLAAVEAAPTFGDGFVNLFNTMMFMHVSEDARRVAHAGIVGLPPTSPQSIELQIGLAKLAWLEGRMGDLARALAASRAIQTDFGGYPNLANLRVFHRYLTWLLEFRKTYQGDAYAGTPERALFFISESHGFGPSETVVYYENLPYRVLSILVTGCKAYHLGRDVDSEYRASVQAVLRAIPEGHPLVFGFGEIDCRLNEGIIKAHREKGEDFHTAVPAMVEKYVEFVTAACQVRQHTPILYGVPAPHPDVLLGRTADDRELLVAVIRAFNDALRQAAQARGLRLLDVHAFTATVEGMADGRHHVDEFHVHPETVRALFGSPRAGTRRSLV